MKLDKIANDGKRAGIGENQTYITSKKSDSHKIMIIGEKLQSLIQVKVKTAVEATQREVMRSRSRHLVEETI